MADCKGERVSVQLGQPALLQNRARSGVPGGAAPLGWWMRRMLESTLVIAIDNRRIHGRYLDLPGAGRKVHPIYSKIPGLPRGDRNLLTTEVDSSIRRYRARFCNSTRFANAKLIHYLNLRPIAALQSGCYFIHTHGRNRQLNSSMDRVFSLYPFHAGPGPGPF
jgi:hypothetical protein